MERITIRKIIQEMNKILYNKDDLILMGFKRTAEYGEKPQSYIKHLAQYYLYDVSTCFPKHAHQRIMQIIEDETKKVIIRCIGV